MGFSDDDYTDDDVYYDDDDDVNDVYDDDEEVSTSRSTSNPFSRPGGSGLPGSSRSSSFGSGSSGGSSDKPSSPFRSGGGSSSFGSGSSGGSADRPSSPFRSGGSSGGSSFGSSRDRDDDKKSDSRRFGGGGSGGSSGGSSFGSSRDRDDKKSDSGGRSFGSSSSSSSSSPFSGSRDRDDKKSDSRRFGGGGSGSSSSGSSFGSSRADDKKDDKKSGSGLGSRFGLGGGDKKDNAKKSGSGGGLLGGLGRAGKGDKKPAASKGGTGSGVGGMLSGVSGLFSRGGGDKKPGARKSEGGGGFLSSFGRGGKDDKSSTASRRPDSGSSFGGSRDQSGGTGQRSAFGSRQTTGESGGRGLFGGGGKQEGGRPAKAEGGSFLSRINIFGGGGEAKAQQRTSKTRAAKVPKTAEGGFQLDLDAKLDILGVVLFFGGMILLISSLSADQGSVTGWFNDIFISLFGWGAMAGPVTMMAIGVWLMVRHFGEEAPVIDPVRVTGIVILYLGILMVMMFIETFNELYSTVTTRDVLLLYLDISVEAGRGGGIIGAELYKVLVQNVGEIGAVFSMIGWFVVGIMLATRTSAAEIAVFVISVWRSFQVSLQRRSQRRRAQRLALVEARQAEQAAQISVSRPAAGELGTGISGALPAPDDGSSRPIEDRPIPIRMGGQMISANVEAGISEHPVAGGRPPITLPQKESSGGRFGGIAARFRKPFGSSGNDTAQAPPTKEESASAGIGTAAAAGTVATLGGLLGSRNGGESQPQSTSTPPASLPERSALPPAPDRTSQQGLFGRDAAASGSTTDSPFARPTSPTSTTTREPGSEPRPRPFQTAAQSTTAGVAPTRDTVPSKDGTPSRPTSSPGGTRPSGTQQPAASSAPATAPERDREAEPESIRTGSAQSQPSRSPFGTPARSSTPPPPPGGTRPSAADRFGLRPSTVDDDDDERDETTRSVAEKAASELPGTGRLDRLEQIRSGQTNVPTTAKPVAADDDEDEDDEEIATTPAASVQNPFASSRLGSVSRPSPFGSLQEDDDDEIDDQDLDDEDLDIDEEIEEDEEEETVAASSAPPWTARPEQPRNLGGTTFTPPTTRAGTPARVPEPAPSARSPFPSSPAAARPDSVAATPTSTPAPAASSEPVINPPRERPAAPPVRVTGGSQQHWRLPDYRTLLASGSDQEFDREGLVRRARIIEETLQSFGAPGRVVEINTGPVITQFGVEPDYLMARGGKKNRVKVGAIAALDKDLQLALGAKSIRVEAPVPGKGYVGIEVPNEEASLVSLRDVMESREFTRISSPLAIALGQGVDGSPVAADLTAMPHLLIAGTTGSGKSVCVNSVITSLVLRNTPETVKFIMVDPKRVELTGYNDLPHLVAPVVVELERIVGVLKWVTREMDERYKRFSSAGARNIVDYNNNVPAGAEIMPFIVVIIDELADLMMLAPDETERVVTRIAALARATGIHLVIATQRPSVDVVTGLIKANFPARIAFAVAGGVDSRVILDQPGAERLLGKGDMLYMSPDSPAPLRLQGVFVSDMEINNITRFWKGQAGTMAPQKPITSLVMEDTDAAQSRPVMPRGERFFQPPPPPSTQRAFWDETAPSNPQVHSSGYGISERERDHDEDERDELYGEALELVRRLNKASVSLLQRRLRIGYTRAARLIDIMEAEGVIGPPTEGSKPREVLPAKK